MTADRAGPEGPCTEGEKAKSYHLRMGLLGFYKAVLVDYVPPWMPAPPVLSAILERAQSTHAAVDTVSPPADSPRR